MQNTLIIGIAGGTGSGKTTLTQCLRTYFENDITVIYHDNYYKAHDELSYEERAKLNYDHPNAFDTELLAEHLAELRAGHSIECPVYDFALYNRTGDTITIKPSRVVILEGILIMAEEALRRQMDIKIFVDTDADVRILRRIVRDVKKRGRSLDSVIQQYLATVKPMHEQYVEPSKRYADIIIPEGGKNQVALHMVMQQISSFLSSCDNSDAAPRA